MPRSYYSDNIRQFLATPNKLILGILINNHQFELKEQQRNVWIKEIEILKEEFKDLASAYIIFEYSNPRMGKRSDVILILNGLVFVIEFKLNETQYKSTDINQCFDYVLDLKYFHEESYNIKIIPILVATNAVDFINTFDQYYDGVFKPLKCNRYNLNKTVQILANIYKEKYIDPIKWENSAYKPTPTIIEAAQALYQGHNVKDISRSDSEAENLTKTADAINKIIEKSKRNKIKSICFITGVPGAGKTLAGLNLANERHKFSEEEHAVFLSGNGPLVQVLQEALARNKVENSLNKIKKTNALRESKAFIQNIHHFRDQALENNLPPPEKVVVFDEAQRAWDQKQTSSFMQRKKRIENFKQSEPEFLISIMDRRKDWCVIVCLIGGGQEINTGEAGLSEWFSAIRKQYNHWQVYVSNEISDTEYTRGLDLKNLFHEINYEFVTDLHLKTSIRSFRSEHVAKFVKAVLDCDKHTAAEFLSKINEKYPIYLTRNIQIAKDWLKKQARSNERYGIIASSKAQRLKPYGIFVELKIDPKNWFLNPKDDIRSSYFLEYVATEFDIQGLELDWTCVAWDADFRFSNQDWNYYKFQGKDWRRIYDSENKLYLKNTYRVLLTRARQGVIIFIPTGGENDSTRKASFYNETYEYLKKIGLIEIF